VAAGKPERMQIYPHTAEFASENFRAPQCPQKERNPLSCRWFLQAGISLAPRLKEMGSNAYRAAHNAPAAEFLDACHRLGMLVMDENRNFGAAARRQDSAESLPWNEEWLIQP
jgi:hypothetical protein